MLELKKITKVYNTGSFTQYALNGVSIKFRECEFASILGPSGSGKTTLLNIIGGLDQYTTGDLIINDISTKKYKDRDWDTYRNHRVGFVFQSYNLIGHQTILSNVELALTLSGVSKKERKKRAIEALEQVGLKDHIYKKPNQLSGGQMQRVAIARALVNDPDIILADEPTGALDSDTSVQIMEILKKVSKTKLVIMVTHNPDLASEYSTRIVKLKDGIITDDSNPVKGKDKEAKEEMGKTKKTRMSFLTALSLSFNNLMTKKGRTILVSFAGSIGIIGIALILSLSAGFQSYIDKIQEDTLTSYPLTIQQESMDLTSLLLSMTSGNGENDGTEVVTEEQYVSNMLSSVKANDIKSLKEYLDSKQEDIKDDVEAISYSYSIDPVIYTKDTTNSIVQVNPNTLFSSMYGGNSLASSFSSYSSMFNQMPDDQDMIDESYQVLKGRFPEKYDEVMLVLNEPNSISDILVYLFGLKDMNELTSMIKNIMNGGEVDTVSEPLKITYDELMNVEFRMVLPTELYQYNKEYKIYEDMSDNEEYIKKLYENGLELKIVGIVAPKEGSNSSLLSSGIAYKSSLITYIIDEVSNTEIVKKQLENQDVDVFSGKRFDSDEASFDFEFSDLVSIDSDALKEAFNFNIDEKTISKLTSGYIEEINNSISVDTTPYQKVLNDTMTELTNGLFDSITGTVSLSDVDSLVSNYLSNSTNKKKFSNLEKKYILPSDTYKTMYEGLLKGLLIAYIATYYAMDQSLTSVETPENYTAVVVKDVLDPVIENYNGNAAVTGALNTVAGYMTEAIVKKSVLEKVGELAEKLSTTIASSFNVDQDKIASAFKINIDDDQIMRIMSAMSSSTEDNTAKANLINLGYQDKDEPSSISVYFTSFDGKEHFLDVLDDYNDLQKKEGHEEKVINYTDTTGILMSSVKTIVNAVSYVLIAFVSVSLVVSSIMIGIITYISVYERTKEIGILRAIGASKHNISSIFSAETFIIGLLSGLFGIGITYALLPIINHLIHSLANVNNLNAVLDAKYAIILVMLSIVLTLIGGFIPSKHASKRDPVIALRTE